MRLPFRAALVTPFFPLLLLATSCAAPPEGEATGSAKAAVTIPAWLAYYDYKPADFDTVTISAHNAGYVPISISAWGSTTNPVLAGVFVQRSGPYWNIQHGIGNAAWQTAFSGAAEWSMKPVQVSFDGDPSNPVWAAVFMATSTGIPTTRNGLYSGSVTDTNALEYWLAYAKTNNLIPSTLSIYGTAPAPAYALVLEPNNGGVQWSVGNTTSGTFDDNMTAADYQAHWSAQVPAGNRVGITDLNGDDQLVSMYRDDSVGPVAGYHSMLRADFDAAFKTQTAAGLFPISIQGGGVVGTTERLAGLFAQTDQALTKTLQQNGSGGAADTAIASIDDAVTGFMSAHGVRQASLAVVDGTKLAYARGYDLQEPGLASVGATSTFRLASVSKVVTAMEIMHLVDRGQLALTDTAQSILHLTTNKGAAPPAAFATITVQNLLQHQYPTLATSGQTHCLLRDVDVSQTAATALGVSLPVSRAGAVSLALANTGLLTRTPSASEGCYSNFGYILLGQIVEAKRGEAFLTAATADLFSPLAITRAHVASSTPGLPAGEALYRPVGLPTLGNVDVAGSPVAENPYGGENFDVLETAGGLSMAATDVARLLAALDKPAAIYTKSSTVQTILSDTLGFDQTDKDQWGAVHYVKGGELEGIQTTVSFVQNGVSYVLFWAHDGLDNFTGADNWWPQWGTLETAIHNASLGARADLFPAYGMPSL
jgi:CubicO group peptidase (beta-lactamase class C family)